MQFLFFVFIFLCFFFFFDTGFLSVGLAVLELALYTIYMTLKS